MLKEQQIFDHLTGSSEDTLFIRAARDMRLDPSWLQPSWLPMSGAGEIQKEGNGMTTYQSLPHPYALAAWQPINGHAVVTCKIHSGLLNGTWEDRTYEFQRQPSGTWIIDTHPGILRRPSWEGVVEWFCGMGPSEIELLTTV